MLRLRKLTHMCSRTVSDPANRFRKTRKKKSSAVPPVSKRSHVGNLRQIRKQGKGRSSKRKGNRRCPLLFAHRRGYGVVPVAAAAHPPLRFSENSPPRQGEPANAVRAPRLSGAGKSCRPSRANRLRSSCAPVNRCRKRVPPRMGEPPARFVHPVKRALCKSKFPKENPHAIG